MMVNMRIGDDDLERLRAMTDDDDERFVSESDVLDPVTVWVRCEMCDDMDVAGEMVWQFDGAWLCASCDRDHRENAMLQMRAVRGW